MIEIDTEVGGKTRFRLGQRNSSKSFFFFSAIPLFNVDIIKMQIFFIVAYLTFKQVLMLIKQLLNIFNLQMIIM